MREHRRPRAHARAARRHPGAGTAGRGIADVLRDVMIKEGLSPADATRRFYALGSRGLLVDDSAALRDFQVPYARPAAEVAAWSLDGPPGLAEVVARVHPTMLIGTSTQAGAFTEEIVREMGAHSPRPIILPLSNPTSKSEATPEDVLNWTDGRALVATGSPFPQVTIKGTTFTVAQANNALVFPGLGLGVVVAVAVEGVCARRRSSGPSAYPGRRAIQRFLQRAQL
jgi:malate dehydrogenase (oxaloacetate-decarboxylating)